MKIIQCGKSLKNQVKKNVNLCRRQCILGGYAFDDGVKCFDERHVILVMSLFC
jgi:hypothetical protein